MTQRQLVPEDWHPQLLDQIAAKMAYGADATEDLGRVRERQAWALLYDMASGNETAWEFLVQFLIDEARHWTDDTATAVQRTNDPKEVFGLVKSRMGAAFGLQQAAHALQPAMLARKAGLTPRGG
jgi:hypothetical protein